MSASNIETKEIRGLSIRNLLAIVGATATIITTVLIQTNSLNNRIYRLELHNVDNEKYDALQLRTIDVRLTTMEVEIKELRERISANSNRIKEIKEVP